MNETNLNELMDIAAGMPDGTNISFLSLLQHMKLTADILEMGKEQLAEFYRRFLEKVNISKVVCVETLPIPSYICQNMTYAVPFVIHKKKL